MAQVHFTPNLEKHVECPPTEVPGGPLADVLDAVFRSNERVRGYVLDEHGAVRHHVVIFVDGSMVQDRTGLTDPVPDDGEVWVMQALSGGAS